ncbi:hypothetical protein [Motilimonas pumila]|uniref:Uncharacterized protein n=1 Tax=Motilimonas pumila TaxID=2303987 RepID=A0A418YCU6_9GAMM|nr:hypothetical protein [Motilimonas pumila]RJG42342.1 hypothetical protein D1Z90_13770 [Motilimonas pumila]
MKSLQYFGLSTILAILYGCGNDGSRNDAVTINDPMLPETSTLASSLFTISGPTTALQDSQFRLTLHTDTQLEAIRWQQLSGPTVSLQETTPGTVDVITPANNFDSQITIAASVSNDQGESLQQQITIQVQGYKLASIEDLTYQGAFRLDSATHGDSTASYSNGAIAYNPNNHSIFYVGHQYHQAIAEFPIPELVKQPSVEEDIRLLNTSYPSQDFVTILDKQPEGNPENLNRTTGIQFYNNHIYANYAVYYDAPGDTKDTSLVISGVDDLANLQVSSIYEMEGAVHSAGWISAMPQVWQDYFGYSHLAGYASNLAINSRSSIGPTAFLMNLQDWHSTDTDKIPTEALMDFGLRHQIHPERYNESGDNNLWTELSEAHHGFIVPGTYTYMVIGRSGGHHSGLGYKITQNNGHTCGGPCAYDSRDYYNYYWLFDMKDMIAVQQGVKQAYEIRPYDYGLLDTPYKNLQMAPEKVNLISGANYDAASNQLFVVLKGAGQLGHYDNPPVILVYQIGQ